jgi:glucan-binding YG repeat protein
MHNRIVNKIVCTVLPFAVMTTIVSYPTFAKSNSSDKKMHTLTYVNLVVNSNIEEGMPIGDEDIEVDVKSSSHVEVDSFSISDYGKKDNNTTSNVKQWSNDDDDDDTDDEGETEADDGAWHTEDEPVLSIVLVPNGDDYQLKLSDDNVHLSGTADPKIDSVSGSGSSVTVKVKLGSLLSGGAALQNIKINSDANELDFGTTDENTYYEVRIYRGSKYVGTYKTEKGQETFNFAPYITSSDTYSFRVRKHNTANKATSNWYELQKNFALDGDEARSMIVANLGSYNSPYARTAEGQWQQNSIGWWWQDVSGTYPADAWRQINNLWYYFDTNGYMVTGWRLIKGHWYYFNNPNGQMMTGWQLVNNTWYYLDATNGTMVTGWQLINGKRYYFGADGKMFANTTTPDGRKVDSSGALIK